MHFARLFVPREPFGNKPAQLFLHLLARSKSVAQSDKRHWNLSRRYVWPPHHSAFPDGWMFQQHRFHLRRRYGESFVFDHFFAAVHDAVKTFAVARDHVARPIPSVAKHSRGRVRLLPITSHELRTAHHQLSRRSEERRVGKEGRSRW